MLPVVVAERRSMLRRLVAVFFILFGVVAPPQPQLLCTAAVIDAPCISRSVASGTTLIFRDCPYSTTVIYVDVVLDATSGVASDIAVVVERGGVLPCLRSIFAPPSATFASALLRNISYVATDVVAPSFGSILGESAVKIMRPDGDTRTYRVEGFGFTMQRCRMPVATWTTFGLVKFGVQALAHAAVLLEDVVLQTNQSDSMLNIRVDTATHVTVTLRQCAGPSDLQGRGVYTDFLLFCEALEALSHFEFALDRVSLTHLNNASLLSFYAGSVTNATIVMRDVALMSGSTRNSLADIHGQTAQNLTVALRNVTASASRNLSIGKLIDVWFSLVDVLRVDVEGLRLPSPASSLNVLLYLRGSVVSSSTISFVDVYLSNGTALAALVTIFSYVTNSSIRFDRCTALCRFPGCTTAWCDDRVGGLLTIHGKLTNLSVMVESSSMDVVLLGEALTALNLVFVRGLFVESANVSVAVLASHVKIEGASAVVVGFVEATLLQNLTVRFVGDSTTLYARSGLFKDNTNTPRATNFETLVPIRNGVFEVTDHVMSYRVYGGVRPEHLGTSYVAAIYASVMNLVGYEVITVVILRCSLSADMRNGTMTVMPGAPIKNVGAQAVAGVVFVNPDQLMANGLRVSLQHTTLVANIAVTTEVEGVQSGAVIAITALLVMGNGTDSVLTIRDVTMRVPTLRIAAAAPSVVVMRGCFAAYIQPIGAIFFDITPAALHPYLPPGLRNAATNYQNNMSLVAERVQLQVEDDSRDDTVVALYAPASVMEGGSALFSGCTLNAARQPYVAASLFCFAGSLWRSHVVTTISIQGLSPSAVVVVGHPVRLSGSSALTIQDATITCTPGPRLLQRPCAVVRLETRLLGQPFTGSIVVDGASSYVAVTANRLVGMRALVMSSSSSGVETAGAIDWGAAAPEAAILLGCNMLDGEPFPSRTTPLFLLGTTNIARFRFPPERGLPIRMGQHACRAPSGHPTQTVSMALPVPPQAELPAVSAARATSTAALWAVAGGALLSATPSANGLSLIQSAVGVIRLGARCAAAGESEGSGSADEDAPFGTERMDNPTLLRVATLGNVLEYAGGAVLGSALLTLALAGALHGASVLKVFLERSYDPGASAAASMRGPQHAQRTHRRTAPTRRTSHERLAAFRAAAWHGMLQLLPEQTLPGALIVPYALLLQPSQTASMLLVAHHSSASAASVALGVFGLLLWTAPLVLFLWQIVGCCRLFPPRYRSLAADAEGLQRGRGRVAAALYRAGRWLMWPSGEWTSPRRGGDEDSRQRAQALLTHYRAVFESYTHGRHWFFAFDFGTAILCGWIVGAAMSVPPEAACGALLRCGGVVVAVTVLFAIAVAMLRPYGARFDVVVSLVMLSLTTAAEIAALAEATETAAECALAAAAFQVCLVVLSIVSVVTEAVPARSAMPRDGGSGDAPPSVDDVPLRHALKSGQRAIRPIRLAAPSLRHSQPALPLLMRAPRVDRSGVSHPPASNTDALASLVEMICDARRTTRL